MKRKWLIAAAIFMAILILVALILLGIIQKPLVGLSVNGRIIATARRSFVGPVFGKSSTDVYLGKEKIFSLHQDFFDWPSFIYPFADGKRFLCDYTGDTEALDFVVDFTGTDTNQSNLLQWPTDEQLRDQLLNMATNAVFDTKGVVRLPNNAELKELAHYLTTTTPGPIKAASLDFINFGTKQLLLDLATNRQSIDP
jgi:hypothetical protein